MDPVSPTRSPKNLGRDQYPGTPPSFRAWDVHTPTTTSSHKRSRLRDTWRSLRSNGKSHRADESSSPRTAQRKKFGWEILATIRSRKPKDANNYQDAATTARPNTTSPSKKNTEHFPDDDPFFKPRRRKSLGDILGTITNRGLSKRSFTPPYRLPRECAVQHREGIARGSEEFTTATSNRETFPIIQTAIPEARHIYGSSDGIDFFAERIERFMDDIKTRNEERILNSSSSSNTWRSQAQTLGDTCGLEQVEVQTSDEHNMTNPPGSSLPQLATADLTAAKEATSTRAPTLEEKNRPRTPDSFLDLLIRAHETLEAERRPKTPDSYLQLLIASHADSPDISGCSRKSIDDSYQFAKGDDKIVMNDLEFNNEKQKASCTTADPEDDNIKSAWFLELTPPTAARKSFPAGVLDLDPQFRLRSEAREVKYQNILTQINSQREEEVNLLVKDLEEISKMTRHSYLSSSSKQNSLESSDDRPEVVSLNSKRIPGKVKLTVPKMTTNLHLSSESSEDGPDHIRNEYTPFNRNDNQVWQSVILGSHFMQEATPFKRLKHIPSHNGSLQEGMYMDRILQESLELRTPYEPIPPYMGRILSESFEFRTPSESQFPRLCRQSIAPPVIILHVPRIRVMKRDIGHGAPTAEVPRVTETKLDIGNDGTTAEFLRMGAMEPGFENDGAILPTVSQLKFRKDGKNPRPSSKKSRYFSLSPITVQIAETDSSPARTEKYASKAQAISALYDQGPDKLSNFCTFDVTNRIIRTYRYGVEHPDEEELRQNGLETMWLPIHGVHDRLLGGLTGENVSKTARRKDVSLLRDDCECLMGSSRDVSMAFVTDTPWTQNSLEKLGSEASLTRRNSRYDAETEFLNRAGTMSESSLGTGYLSHALATMVTSGPENDCLSRDSTMRKSYRSTLASDRGRAILDDDDFFMEVDPELARSYLGSQYSQSPRTSLLDIERLQEEEHITDPNVRRELQGVYETLSSEWAAPERGWIDLDRSYLSDSSQIDLAQPGQEGTFNEENLATRKVSFRCCSSNRPCVEHSEDGVDTTASLDDSPQQDVDTGYVVNPFRTQTTAKPVEIVSHRRRSSSEIPYAEHIEDVALEQMSLGNSLQQGVQASPEVNVRRRATAMLVKIVSPMPHQPMYLQHAEESFCSAGANTKEKGRNRSLTIPADNCDIPKSLQSRERTISHSAYPVAGLDSVATTSRTSDSPSKKTHRRSRLYCSISRDREWPSYATVRRSPRRRAFQSDLRKEFAEMPFASVINGADNVDDRRPSSADSFTSGYHFSKVGDYMVEREQVADIIQDAKTELAANNQELVKGFLKTTTELVADDDKIPNVINDIEPFKAHESPSLRLKPVTAEDLNLKIVGKAARNSQLAKKKTKKVGALVDIFQAHGLMPGIMGPKRYGMSSPSFAHHSSGRPASVSPRVVSRSGTVYGTAGTGCVASTGSRQYSPIKGIPTPFSYPMRLSSSISYTDTEVSSMFGEPLEEVNRHEDEDKEEIHPDIRVTVASSSKIPRVRWIVGDSGDDTYPLSFSDSEQLEEVVKYEDEDKNEGICPDARAVIENSAKMPVPDVL